MPVPPWPALACALADSPQDGAASEVVLIFKFVYNSRRELEALSMWRQGAELGCNWAPQVARVSVKTLVYASAWMWDLGGGEDGPVRSLRWP